MKSIVHGGKTVGDWVLGAPKILKGGLYELAVVVLSAYVGVGLGDIKTLLNNLVVFRLGFRLRVQTVSASRAREPADEDWLAKTANR